MSKLTTLEQLRLLAARTKAEQDKLSGRINDLVTAGGEPNKLEGVKVNGVALSIANKMVDILVASGSANGTISVNGADVAVKGLAALAYKAEVSEAELSAALKAVIEAKAEKSVVEGLSGSLSEVSGKLNTLIGEDANKSARTIANEELAKQLIPGNADEALNTLTEIAQWIQDHPDDAAAMNTAITNLTNLVGTLPAGATSTTVVEYIAEAIAAIGIGDYAKTSEVTTAISNALKNYYTKDEVNAMVATATDTEVNAMLTDVFGAES